MSTLCGFQLACCLDDGCMVREGIEEDYPVLTEAKSLKQRGLITEKEFEDILRCDRVYRREIDFPGPWYFP